MFFRSTDGGATWTEQDPGLPHQQSDGLEYFFKVQQIDSLNAVAVGDTGFIMRTTDGGNTWVQQNLNTTAEIRNVHFSDPMTGIVVLWEDSNRILTTSDGGTNWTVAPFRPWLTATMCHSDGGENFRVITYQNGPVYSTSDDWMTVDSTPLIYPFSDTTPILGYCNFRGLDTLVGYGDNPGHGPLLITSTDGGMHWSNTNFQNGYELDFLCMSSLDRDIVFCGGQTGGSLEDGRHIAKSTDHGMTWSTDTLEYAYDTSPSFIYSLTVTPENHGVAIFGGPGNLQTVLVLGAPLDKVETFPILDSNVQIYPNPSASSVTITSFEAGSTVHLLDILGREVLQAMTPASETLTLDVSSLPSGLYYISDGLTRAKFVKE